MFHFEIKENAVEGNYCKLRGQVENIVDQSRNPMVQNLRYELKKGQDLDGLRGGGGGEA